MSLILRELESTLVTGLKSSRLTLRAGGFDIFWTEEDPSPWMNYAVPVADYKIAELTAAFAAISRTPRIEFFSDLHPELMPMLICYGFTVDIEAPIMAMKSDACQLIETTSVQDAGPDDAKMLSSVTDVAFGNVSTLAQIQLTSEAIGSGRMYAALAFAQGEPVAAGFAIGDDRVREIAGVATLPEFRRKGYAKSVIAHLLNRFFAAGGHVAWLTPGDDGAHRLYISLGFREVGTQINMNLSG